MTDQRCALTELPSDSCDHCRNAGKPRRPTAPVRITGWLDARYPGQCRVCGQLFSAGARITASDTDGWIAECCADEWEDE